MKSSILDNIMDIKVFLKTIAHYQDIYWKIEDSIKFNPDREKPVTADHVKLAYKEMNYIAEEVARFILNRNTRVNIYNLEQLE